jgi:hypothetical protein
MRLVDVLKGLVRRLRGQPRRGPRHYPRGVCPMCGREVALVLSRTTTHRHQPCGVERMLSAMRDGG